MLLKSMKEKSVAGRMRTLLFTGVVALSFAGAGGAMAAGCTKQKAQWLSGDFHQHTLYTDGSTSFDFVMGKDNAFGLDWWANSEHGGGRNRDGEGHLWTDPNFYPTNPILGDVSGNPQVMWRWQSIRDFVFPDILRNRALYPDRKIFSGLEWNVPAHEHCSTGIVADDASAISAFEFQFDKSDADKSRIGEVTPYGTLVKSNKTHTDSVAACQWMEDQYRNGTIDNGWIIFAHVERAGVWKGTGGGYNIENFRDFNNAAPDICFGFEGAPGHQVNNDRGFGNTVTCDENGACTSSDFGGSYGGVGYYSAKVGGLWDALLGEGRHWFNFANSDYHSHYTVGGDDFYPGEYQKTWVYAVDKNRDGDFSLDEIADAMRSGNAYFVHGDLINHLEFEAQNNDDKVPMGGEVKAGGTIKNLKLKIKFKSPESNNCMPNDYITSCSPPKVDHIDLIAGEITGKVDPGDPNYTKATNPTTKVIATFDANDFETDKEGYSTIVYHIKNVHKNMYFRLRGTNLAPNTPFETDAEGNPLPDALATKHLGIDGAQEAWNDLWFYSNPIFVYVK
ncbi:hypothetical protein [Desulforhabdus sp. TSK]|uniref:hypothetical protein n=1 Tax=Desulforhabdus sp. TSK TaxID=2925014 RepID=UPI001FC7F8A9|nr:hypothetical protein [Desulforhabdus sp. TSK]GKT10166.1 hypothetical protein DSTSK_34710 [Desulforhabdus sp. TSK]